MAPQSRDGFVTVDGVRLHHRVWGEDDRAPKLVLTHGMGGTPYMWDDFAEAMSDRFQVFALETRGHGASDRATDYSTPRLAQDIASWAGELGIERLSLVGGTATPMLLAARWPDLVERLVVLGGGPAVDAASLPAYRAIAELVQAVAKSSFGSIEEVIEFMRVSEFYSSADPRILERRVRHNVKAREDGRLVFDFDALGILGGQRERPSEAESWAMFASITCPVLIVRGANSRVLPRETAQRMVQALPGSTLVEVPNAGHGIEADNHDGFLSAVRPFLLGQS